MMDSHPDNKKPHVHVMYEYGPDFRPYSSPFLRLIRPFSHPLVQAQIHATFSRDFNQESADAVIVDRLWRPDVSLEFVEQLVKKICKHGVKFIYSLDDDYFDLPAGDYGQNSGETQTIVTFLLHHADAVLVTTESLRERLLEYNPNIHVLNNQLDERLLISRNPADALHMFDKDRIVIGYMGTFTHDEDFLMIVPALKSIVQRYPRRIEVQVIGVVQKEETKRELQALPIRYIYPRPEEHEYPLFMLWYTGHVYWDIAISPLRNTPFNNCKSDIKFLDYASIGAAGCFSQSPAYSSSVVHRQNGWIAENTPQAWEEALEALITNADLRLGIAQNATQYLYRDRILAKRAMDWINLIKMIC
jgi:glycosyltransferase involved in cell wall biosynthesis